MKIELAVDTTEAEEFKKFLENKGHDVTIGRSTGNYVNGVWTDSDEEASTILNDLWAEYCNS